MSHYPVDACGLLTRSELRAAVERVAVDEALARLPWGVRVGEPAP